MAVVSGELQYDSYDDFSIRKDYCANDDDNTNIISLNYSKEDIHALAVKAEQLVLRNSQRKKVKYKTIDTSSDSDYESKQSRDCFISSEPNIYQRRTSPCRKKLNSRRKDWRNSLPECLEYFTPSKSYHSTPSKVSRSHSPSTTPSESGSRSSTRLSDLWEQVRQDNTIQV